MIARIQFKLPGHPQVHELFIETHKTITLEDAKKYLIKERKQDCLDVNVEELNVLDPRWFWHVVQ